MPGATGASPEGALFVTEAEMREREKANLEAALRHTNGRVWGAGGAAHLLGIKPSTLKYRMKALDITPSSWQARPRRT
jgi:transcriptional regulator with GAF, ATPase, and Fis domain